MSARRNRMVAMLLAMAVLSSCQGYDQPAATTSATTVVSPTAEATPIPFPIGCRPEEVTRLVTDFLTAFNNGEQDRLVRFFPTADTPEGVPNFKPEQFQWYSATVQEHDGAKRHFVTYRRAPLFAYFAERHRQHERLQVRELGVTPTPDPRTVSIIFTLDRQADDLPAAPSYGKGEIHCPSGTISRWSG